MTAEDITPIIAAQIACLNVVRHGVQGDLGLVPHWQQTLNLNDKATADFFFKSCANAAAAANHGISTDVVARRMGALARRACKVANTVQAWDSFLQNGTASNTHYCDSNVTLTIIFST